MSQIAWTGLPGSGKSFGVVQNVILPALLSGRVVVTNIPMQRDGIEAAAPGAKLIQLDKKCTVEQWLEAPGGAVIVIDEAQHWWPSGMTADKIPASQKAFFAEHRHRVGNDGFATEIYTVGQDLGNIASFVRNLVEQTFRVTKLSAVGASNRFRVDVYDGAVTGQRPPKSQLLRQIHGRYSPDIYALYHSHTQSKTGAAGMEVKPDKRGTIFGSWTIRAAVAAVVLLPFGVWAIAAALGNFKSSVTKGKGERSEPAPLVTPQPVSVPAPSPTVPVAAATPPEAAPAPADDGPKLSGRWRIAGTIERRDGTGIAMLRSATATRRVKLADCDRGDIDLDLRCEIDGELVTFYSGDTGGFATAAVAPGVVGGK